MQKLKFEWIIQTVIWFYLKIFPISDIRKRLTHTDIKRAVVSCECRIIIKRSIILMIVLPARKTHFVNGLMKETRPYLYMISSNQFH